MGHIGLVQQNNTISLSEIFEIPNNNKNARIKIGRNKEKTVPLSNILVYTQVFISNDNEFVQFSEKALEMSSEIDLEIMWGKTNHLFNTISIPALYDALEIQKDYDLYKIALLLKINKQNRFFKLINNQIIISSNQAITELLMIEKKLEKEKEKEKAIASLLANDRLNNTLNVFEAEIIAKLKNFVLYGENYLHFADAVRFATEHLNIIHSHRQSLFSILVKNKILSEHEPFEIYQQNINLEFDAKIDELSNNLTQQSSTISRVDLTNTRTFTIDNASTNDRDDAFSIEANHLWIHITDLSNIIKGKSTLDIEARNRNRSIYLPDMTIPMLPTNVSNNLGSINCGQIRECLSLDLEFNEASQIINWEFKQTIIKSSIELSYDQADEILLDKYHYLYGLFKKLNEICFNSKHERELAGAFSFNRPDIKYNINDLSNIEVHLIDATSPSRELISELMIIFNQYTGVFCYSNKIPSLYRSQENINLPHYYEPEPYFWFNASKNLRPAKISTSPKEHAGLGTALYIQASSPLRRYGDLVMQRQICNFINNGNQAYSIQEIASIATESETKHKKVRKIEVNRKKYWFIVFLDQIIKHAVKPVTFKAIALEEQGNSMGRMFELSDYPFRFRTTINSDVKSGKECTVQVRSVDLWNEIVDFKQVT